MTDQNYMLCSVQTEKNQVLNLSIVFTPSPRFEFLKVPLPAIWLYTSLDAQSCPFSIGLIEISKYTLKWILFYSLTYLLPYL